MKLNEIDKIEVICLVDNHVDLLLPSTMMIKRPLVKVGLKNHRLQNMDFQ